MKTLLDAANLGRDILMVRGVQDAIEVSDNIVELKELTGLNDEDIKEIMRVGCSSLAQHLEIQAAED